MTTFILIAILLLLAAVSVVVIPLLRKNAAIPGPAVGAAFAAAGVLVFGGGALYATWSNWNWQAPAEDAVTPENMVSRLARRLEKDPNDVEGRRRLARAYAVLEQYPLAGRPYQRSNELGVHEDGEERGRIVLRRGRRVAPGRSAARAPEIRGPSRARPAAVRGRAAHHRAADCGHRRAACGPGGCTGCECLSGRPHGRHARFRTTPAG